MPSLPHMSLLERSLVCSVCINCWDVSREWIHSSCVLLNFYVFKMNFISQNDTCWWLKSESAKFGNKNCSLWVPSPPSSSHSFAYPRGSHFPMVLLCFSVNPVFLKSLLFGVSMNTLWRFWLSSPLGDNSLWVLGVSACLASRGANSCVSDHLFKDTAFKLSVISPPEQRAVCLQSWMERVFSSREKSRSAYCLWRKVQLHKTWGSSLATQLMMYTGTMNVHGRGIEAFRIKGKMRVFPRGPVADSVLTWVVRELDPTCHS